MTDLFDDVEANIDATPAAKTRKPRAATSTASAGDRVTIILEESDDIPPTGQFIGLNGVGYLIRPGEEVTVPRGVVEILEHAVISMPTIDPQTKQVIGHRDRMRYPFRIVNR